MVDLEQPISHGVNCILVKKNVPFAYLNKIGDKIAHLTTTTTVKKKQEGPTTT